MNTTLTMVTRLKTTLKHGDDDGNLVDYNDDNVDDGDDYDNDVTRR